MAHVLVGHRAALCLLLLLLVLVMEVSVVEAYTRRRPQGRQEQPKKVPVEEVDYYAVLGLGEARDDATERDIKTAWRKLSKKHHPDIAGEAERELYQRIQRAYEVLGDRRKRKVFDILGEEGVRKLEQPQQQQQQANPFFQLFGQGASDRGADVQMLLLVPLEDMYAGATHTIQFTKNKVCRACKGTGAKSHNHIVECPHCHGSGKVLQNVEIAFGFVQTVEQPCPRCGGRGRHIKERCPVCSGKQITRGSVAISVDVEMGLPEGHILTFDLEADQQPGQVPGDVLLTVMSDAHPTFERKGNDLFATVAITLKEALLGFHKTLKHLDGHEVQLEAEGITQHDAKVRVAGEGMPRHHVPSEHGDLYITYKVELPDQLTEEQRAGLLEAFVKK